MKREIKFRGKDEQGEWQEGYLLIQLGIHYILTPIWEIYRNEYVETDRSTKHRVNACTVGQFTGLLDKNGKEVYEGDILRGDKYPFNCDGVDNYFAEIVWADNVCGFYRITLKKPDSTVRGASHGNWEQLDEDDMKFFEVIGNIHDNPELLKD